MPIKDRKLNSMTFQVFHGLYEPCVMLKQICYTSSFLVRLPSTLRPYGRKYRWQTTELNSQGQIRGKTIVIKKSQFRGNFLGKFRLKGIGFAVISRTVLMKQNGKFAIFAGGWKWWALACVITTTTTEPSTTYKCCVLEPAIWCSKRPLALRSLLDLVLSRTRFFLISDHHLPF